MGYFYGFADVEMAVGAAGAGIAFSGWSKVMRRVVDCAVLGCFGEEGVECGGLDSSVDVDAGFLHRVEVHE